ncbi:MAG: hypothetical protein GY764_11825 [Halieaceae bacterium]|nr:hypothetical protein [Halieaceae bacterium]
MNRKTIPCHLTLDNGYGISWVEARISAVGYHVYSGCDTEPELMPGAICVGATKDDYSWSKFARSLLTISDGWIDRDDCGRAEVEGESGVRADILRIAWSQDQKTTIWLLAQTDEGLDILEAQFPRLADKENRAFLDTFLDAVEELNAEPQVERLHMAFRPAAGTTDLRAILAEMEKRIYWINNAREKERTEKLAPFLAKIEQIAIQFDDTPSRGGGITAPSKRQRVTRWLRLYAGRHGELPRGNMKYRFPSTEGTCPPAK